MGQRNDIALVRGAVDRAAVELPRLALSAQTERAMSMTWYRFSDFAIVSHSHRLVADLTPETAGEFVRARHANGSLPSTSTLHWRRSAIRLLYRIWRDLDLAEGDPTLDLRLPPRSSLPTRPLTDDEVAMCRWASLATTTQTRLPAVWALAEAGATSGEIPQVCGLDVDLRTQTVWLGGSTKTDARTALLTEWGAVQLRRRVKTPGRDPAAPISYEGLGSPERAQASVSGAIGDMLRRAGLGDEPDVRPRSVTAWAGLRIFRETGQIEAVAQHLGLRSLDRSARLICWDWRQQ